MRHPLFPSLLNQANAGKPAYFFASRYLRLYTGFEIPVRIYSGLNRIGYEIPVSSCCGVLSYFGESSCYLQVVRVMISDRWVNGFIGRGGAFCLKRLGLTALHN